MKNSRAETNAGKLLVLLGLLAFCLAAAAPLFAAPKEAPGDGASLWAALQGGSGLEVRDELNRPVSRGRIEREVRSGAVAMLRQSSSYAGLSALLALLEVLERSDLLCDALRPAGLPARPAESAALRAKQEKARLQARQAQEDAPAQTPRISSASLPISSHRALALPLLC
ncbi:MAG: hypothetical protein HY922_15740 [Elusimicrobia bacterium]|nr:hypothetical protein [Elusimicrobiota bacterium]